MEQELTILLVEDDIAACNEISHYVEALDDVTLTDITNNALTALQLVQDTCPDAVILDLELHGGGGNGLQFLALLNQLQLTRRPYILITTNNSSKITCESAHQLGADFILAKYESNYSAQYVIEFLRMMRSVILKHTATAAPAEDTLAPIQKQRHILQRIQKELNQIGISPKAIGYQYLTDAILIKIMDPNANLLGTLGEKYKKSDASIERAMQNAIGRAWRTNDPEDLLRFYTARIRSERGVPTIMEFVFYYATMLKVAL